MNFDRLRASDIVRLRPHAHRQFPDGTWHEIDDDWTIESAKKEAIELRNLRSATRIRLHPDHVHDYVTDSNRPIEEKRGFLRLLVKIHINNSNGTTVEPLPVSELKTAKSRNPNAELIAPRDAWDAISLRYSSRPDFWEQAVTCDFIENALLSGSKRLKELSEGLVYRRVEHVTEDRVFTKIRELFAEMMSIAEQLDPALKQIVPAWGPKGVPGNLEDIRQACARLRDLINALVEWEVEVYFIRPAENKHERLFLILRGSVNGALRELNRIPTELRTTIEKAKTDPGPHLCDLQLKLDAPPNLEELQKEMKRLQGGLFRWLL